MGVPLQGILADRDWLPYRSTAGIVQLRYGVRYGGINLERGWTDGQSVQYRKPYASSLSTFNASTARSGAVPHSTSAHTVLRIVLVRCGERHGKG